MRQIKQYTYLGINGTITSSVLLENVPKIEKYLLIADELKQLTKDDEHFYNTIIIPADELSLWKEVNESASLK